MDVKKVKEQLVAAGIEVYRTRPAEIHVAERVRLHIMDSGVRVQLGEELRVSFTARSQRSDFPDEASETELFARIRSTIGPGAVERGYVETWSGTTPVTDPVDAEKILDVYHEVTWTKPADGADSAIAEVQWALGLERYVPPASVPPGS
ncbi:MAG: hypothetical protein M3Y87_17105 [Myxococcota bacterium]|nr:hypothetical protein [Myxococcota bacterium]